jgi:cupin 2 domain-containing protein
MMTIENIFNLPDIHLEQEIVDTLLNVDNIRIERIVSKGHTSPDEGWYDQEENEWVIVLEGSGKIEFEEGVVKTLNRGDFINIPAHQKHKVIWTDPNQPTIWLAIFY